MSYSISVWTGLLVGVLVSISIYLIVIYIIDDVKKTRAGRTFRILFPIAALLFFGSLTVLNYTYTRLFGSTSIFGITLEHSLLLNSSVAMIFLSFPTGICLLIWIGWRHTKQQKQNQQ